MEGNNYRGMDWEKWRGREREADRGNDGQTVIIEEWTGNSGGEEKERQTEETMDRQCRGMDREQGTVEGKRKRGRQRKRWTDSAEERTGNSGGEERGEEKERGREREADRGNDRQTIIIEEWTGNSGGE